MVHFLNCFEVPASRDEEFLSLWREVNAYMARKPGYVSHRLHRALADDARFRFINTAEWESPRACQEAHDDGFRALVGKPQWRAFRSTPGLFEIVHEGSAELIS
ncbi:antibiotic biosynthesis monooxygenase [Allobranchiibius sp. GilTou38]|uniref:antibiotic biosynthesis monooxygenase family protein n=1 Tax=Allobranchiibius sp. GilTou38 TaxID=2815210 RepID=UPI001AA1C20A|nr:antibiotic biosynthesis monooxygenase [Allobranchiibius sp. GilTou38]MBO1767586.1 antibiotic biosynthesis monooxygenase [Allobranchiibius sp. GilTou38]